MSRAHGHDGSTDVRTFTFTVGSATTNEHAPVSEALQEPTKIVEWATAGTSVLHVTATDDDTTSPENKVSYTIGPIESDGVLHVILPIIGGLVTIGILSTIIIVWIRRKSKKLHQSESAPPVALYDLPDHIQSKTGAASVALSENRTEPIYETLSEYAYEALSDNRPGPTYEGLSEQRTGATYEAFSKERKETAYSKISGETEVTQENDYLEPRQSYMVPFSKPVTADYIEIN